MKQVRVSAGLYRYLAGENPAGMMLNPLYFDERILPRAVDEVLSVKGSPKTIKFSVFDEDGDEYQFLASRYDNMNGEIGNEYFLHLTIPRFEIPREV
jgi:hypothetical protein